jgi:toxin CptA
MQYPVKIRSSNRVAPLHIHCRTSRKFQLLVLGIGLFTASVLGALIVLHSVWFVAGMPALFLYVKWFYRTHAIRTSPGSVTDLYRFTDGGWQLHFYSGQIEQAVLLGDSIVLPTMILLRFKRPGTWKIRIVILMPDALGEDKYRRVCVQLLTSQAETATN